jgi:hypothetical protein
MSSLDLDYDIEKPLLKDDKWLIFNDTVFSHLDTLDCNDTIEGECYKNRTFDECIKTCNDNSECSYGYYLSANNINYCVPIRDPTLDVNPCYRLRKKDIYTELKNASVKTFINKNINKFPPVEGNTVFYMDNFVLQNIETSTMLGTSPLTSDSEQLKFNKSGNIIMQLMNISPNYSKEQYITLKYGDEFCFNIPNTNIVIRESIDYNIKLEWNTIFDNTDNILFHLEPLNPTQKIGDKVCYSDSFIIRANSYYTVGISSTYIMEKQRKPDNYKFRFIPKMVGFYCNNDNKCVSTPLEEMVINDKGIGTKDGFHIVRNPGCWGICKYKNSNQSLDLYKRKRNHKIYYIIVFILLAIVIRLII